MNRAPTSAFAPPACLPLACAALLSLAACGGPGTARYDVPAAPPLAGQLTLNVADTALAGDAPALALHVTQSILAKDPNNAPALQRQGDAYFGLGQVAEAEASYRRALAIRPDFPAAQLGMGRIEIARDPATAEARFAAVATADPHNLVALNDLGIAHDLRGHHAEAQAAYRTILALAPANLPAQVNLGLSLALSGNTTEALALLQPLAARPDTTPRTRQDYAVALAISGRTADAEQVLRVDMTQEQAAAAVRGYRTLPGAGDLPAQLD